MKVKVTAHDGLNIRADSNTDAEIFEKVAYGTVLEALDWLFVKTPAGNEGWAASKYLEPLAAPPGPIPVPDKEVPWLVIARKELGVNETDNPKRVVEYHQATSLKAQTPKVAWCSSFACWCMEKSGTQNARVKSKWDRKSGYWVSVVWCLRLNELHSS